MKPLNIRVLLMACLAAAVLGAVPAQSHACSCLDWIWPWNWGRGATASTTYAPPYSPTVSYAAPVATSSCVSCTPQVCSYVPQTCYRTVCDTVPTTVCQPVTACDPCTGCPVTTYRPVTTLTRRVRLVPYTTYRMVWSNVTSIGSVSCDPCGGVGYSAPAAASSTCPSCVPSPSSTPAPYYNGATGGSVTTTPSLSTPAPSEKPAQNTTPPKTFEQKPTTQPESRLKPIPDTENESRNLPRLIDPESRTTARPIQHAALHRTVSLGKTSPSVSSSADGWRASRD